MRRLFASGVLAGVAFVTMAGPLWAHEGSSEATLTVEPSQVTAGGTVLLAGSGLEADDERVLLIQGEGITVALDPVTTDAEGMLDVELTIPAHLPTGVYQIQAIGDETLSVDLNVTASAAGADDIGQGDAVASPRNRAPFELGLILAFAAVSAAVGLLLAMRSERFLARASS